MHAATLGRGGVRCLGWENLDRGLAQLAHAIAASLQSLGVPFSVVAHSHHQPPAFVATPAQPSLEQPSEQPTDQPSDQPSEQPSDDGLNDAWMPMSSPALRVCIYIESAEAENAGKHHVRLRRQQGSHWRLQAFYSAFRHEMSQELGLSDEKQLSLYSPMTPKRTFDAANIGPLSAWSRGALEQPQHVATGQQLASDKMRRVAKVPMLLLAQAPRAGSCGL